MDVGKLVAYLTVDDTAFDAGLKAAERHLTSVGKTAGAVGKTVATGFTVAAGATAAMGAQLFKTGANYNVLQQNSRAALKTILGSTEAVNKQMAKLDDLASKSPFSKSIFLQGQQQLLAFGMQAEKVVPTLNAVQNAVAATGGSGQQLSDLVFVMAQIQAAGKITGQDLLQMGQRGVNAAELIGNAMGMSAAEVKAAITANKISATDALDAITSGMMQKFGGATDNIKQQWTGTSDRIKAAWRDIGATIARPFIDPNGGGQAVIWGNRVADIMRQAHAHVSTIVSTLSGNGATVFDSITTHLERAAVAVARFNPRTLIETLGAVKNYTAPIAAAGAAIATLGGANIPILGRLVAGINPLVAALAALAATTPEIRHAGATFLDALAPVAPLIADTARAVGDLLLEAVARIAPHLEGTAIGVANLIRSLTPLAGVAVDVAAAFLPLVNLGGQLIEFAASLPAPLLAAVAAMVALRSPVSAAATGIASLIAPTGAASQAIRAFKQDVTSFGVLATIRGHAAGLAGAFTSLISPAGLVTAGLGALIGVVSMYAQKKAEAEARTRAFKNSLEEETGALTDNTRAQVAANLSDQGALETAEKLGISATLLTDAISGEAGARERLTAELDRQKGVTQDLYQAGELSERQAIQRDASINALASTYANLSSELDNAIDAKEREINATRSSADAKKLEIEASQALVDAERNLAAAKGDLIAAQYATKDAFAKTSEAAQELSGHLEFNGDSIDTSSNRNRAFVESVKANVDAIHREIDAYAKSGATQSELKARYDELVESLVRSGEASGATVEQMRALAEEVGLLPESTLMEISTVFDGTDAKADIAAMLKEVQKGGTLTIDAKSDPAAQELARMLGIVEAEEGIFAINATSEPALAELFLTMGRVNTSTGVVTIDGNSTKAAQARDQAVASINRQSGTVTIYGRDYATRTAEQARNYINNMVATMHIQGVKVGNGWQGGTTLADGAVMRYYASGGFERHTAQIAPAGSWRVWAEPETGGEAYIPLSPLKRSRSEQILSDVAALFGGFYVKRGSSFAEGGFSEKSATVTSDPFAGMKIEGVLEIAGDGLARLIDGRIVRAVSRNV